MIFHTIHVPFDLPGVTSLNAYRNHQVLYCSRLDVIRVGNVNSLEKNKKMAATYETEGEKMRSISLPRKEFISIEDVDFYFYQSVD